MKTITRKGFYPALVAVLAVAAALAWSLGGTLSPAGPLVTGGPPVAEAQGYQGLVAIARISVPAITVAYPGANTHIPYQRYDASGNLVEYDLLHPTKWLHDAGVAWEAADDKARAIVNDLDGFGSSYGDRLWIRIKADARPGLYNFKVRTRARSADHVPAVTTTMKIAVAGPPDHFRAYLNKSAYRAGDSITIRATALDASGNRATYVRSTQYGHGIPLACRDCGWTAGAGAGAVLTADSGSLNSGRAGVRIRPDAAPGTYSINVTHPQIPARELRFTVRPAATPTPTPGPTPAPGETPTPTPDPGRADPPASYALSDGAEIAAGAALTYRVTARSATGGVPNLDGANGQVYVIVDGAGAAAVTLAGAEAGGLVTLNSQGVGRFGVQVAEGTEPTTISLEIVGAVHAEPVTRRVSVGSVPPPRNVTLAPAVDDQGATTSVTMTWVPGSGTTSQVVVVVNANDDTDYCLTVLPVDASTYTCENRTPGETYVGLVIGLLPDDGYTLGNVVTITLPAA